MKKRYLLLLTLLSFSLFSCKTKNYTASNLPEIQLRFGNGGGFVGAYTEYILLENGQLFKRSQLDGPLEELPEVKKAKAKKMFKQMEEENFLSMERNAPGNMYRFLNCTTPKDSNKVVWGSTEKAAVDSLLDSLYKECMALVKQ